MLCLFRATSFLYRTSPKRTFVQAALAEKGDENRGAVMESDDKSSGDLERGGEDEEEEEIPRVPACLTLCDCRSTCTASACLHAMELCSIGPQISTVCKYTHELYMQDVIRALGPDSLRELARMDTAELPSLDNMSESEEEDEYEIRRCASSSCLRLVHRHMAFMHFAMAIHGGFSAVSDCL